MINFFVSLFVFALGLQQYPSFTVYHGIKVDGCHTMYICLFLLLKKYAT